MKKIVSIKYASEMLVDCQRKDFKFIEVPTTSVKGDFIVIEKEGTGIFIGVIGDDAPTNTKPTSGYVYVKTIDLSDYIKEKENAKRKKELKQQMEERFAIIDKEKKYQYYAELDSDFKALFEEYKSL